MPEMQNSPSGAADNLYHTPLIRNNNIQKLHTKIIAVFLYVLFRLVLHMLKVKIEGEEGTKNKKRRKRKQH